MKRIFVDGASRGNPGPAAIAFIVEPAIADSRWDEYNALTERDKTNNEAEYIAVYQALWFAHGRGKDWKDIEIITDSRLVVEQLSGNWDINKPELQKLAEKIRGLVLFELMNVKYTWAPRTHPMLKRADKLCNDALDGKGASGIIDEGENGIERHTWTVGKLRKAIEYLKDDMPVVVSLITEGDLRERRQFMLCFGGDGNLTLEIL